MRDGSETDSLTDDGWSCKEKEGSDLSDVDEGGVPQLQTVGVGKLEGLHDLVPQGSLPASVRQVGRRQVQT